MRNLALRDATTTESPRPNQRPDQRPGPRSSDRALQLLCVVGEAKAGLSLTEAAAAVGLVPSTALRQLRALEAAGLVARDGDQLYRAGARLIDLARTVFVGHSLAMLAQPFLDAVAAATGESTYLAVPEGRARAVYVATAAGQHALRHSGWLGRGFRHASTAVGAALRGKVDGDGAVCREGTLEPGITAVAAPVLSAHGVIAALNVVGPTFRLSGPPLAAARRDVTAAAADLTRQLTSDSSRYVSLL